MNYTVGRPKKGAVDDCHERKVYAQLEHQGGPRGTVVDCEETVPGAAHKYRQSGRDVRRSGENSPTDSDTRSSLDMVTTEATR